MIGTATMSIQNSNRRSNECNSLVAINGILQGVGNGVEKSLFADNIAVYIPSRG